MQSNTDSMARARLPRGLRFAIALYVGLRLPLLLGVGILCSRTPYGPGMTQMPKHVPSLWNAWLRWDSGWYVRIVTEGYRYIVPNGGECQSSIAFYPLYPMLAKALMLLGLPMDVAMMLLSNGATILGVWGMYELACERTSKEVAPYAAAAVLLTPTSLFLTSGYAEGVLLCAGVWACVFFERRRIIPLALCIGAAVVSRSHGVILAGALVFGAAYKRDLRLLCSLCIGAAVPMALHLGYQWRTFNEPLAFLRARACWGVQGPGAMERLLRYALTVGNASEIFDLVTAAWLGVSGILVWRKFGAHYGVFVLGTLAVMLQSGQLWGMSRIGLSAFVVALLIGEWAHRSRLACALILAICVPLLVYFSMAFVHGDWVS
jgi:hypothetical protein